MTQTRNAAGPAAGSGTAWHTLAVDDALKTAGVSAAAGLSPEDAKNRAATYGPNAFTAGTTEPFIKRFLRQYTDPMQIVLLVAGLVSWFVVDEVSTGVLLIVLTLFNAWMGLNQEGKAAAAVSALQGMMILKTRVRRGGELVVVPAEELVPGDIVAVEAGDRVPADGRIISAATLEIDESALTGESVPVPKSTEPAPAVDTPLGDRIGMAYMNTNVTRGSGEILVTSTGMTTEVGKISGLLNASAETDSPLTKQLKVLTNQLLVIAGIALAASMAIGLSRGEEFQTLFVTAIAFAVSAIPTGLPAVVTTILSMGTQELAKAGAIMKRLRSVETLGATSAINSDKTGTLTLNQMTAVSLAIPGRRYEITGSGYAFEGQISRVAGQSDVPLDGFLMPMVLASDAQVKDGELIGDPTEGALVVLAAKGGVSPTETREAYPRLATLPFDSDYKMMATFHAMKDESGKDVVRAFVKGAPDQLLARGTMALDPGDLHPIPGTAELKANYLAENERLGKQGLRVMATGRKDFDPATFDPNADLLPLLDGMTLLALVGIVDPPRPSARASIEIAHKAGIQVRMITGDHAITAEAIAQQLGIRGRAITGAEWAAMSDEQAIAAIDDIGVIARVTPQDKVRLVDILKAKGHIVAMTGDGVNDAPALKKADIGVAMGITGTEVSKEAAVMILTDDDFSTIVKAVEMGRGLYDNLKKYIRFQMGGLFGFITAFLGASIFSIAGGIPFLPLQTLWINFTVTVFQAIGLGYGKPADGLMLRKPRPAVQPILPKPLLIWLAFIGVQMGVVTLAVLSWGDTQYGEDIARSMGVTVFSIFNIAFAWATKDELRSLLDTDVAGDRYLVRTTILSVITVFLATEFGPLQRLLGTVSLTFDQWVVCWVAGLSVLLTSEIKKRVYHKPLDEGEALVEPESPSAATAASAA